MPNLVRDPTPERTTWWAPQRFPHGEKDGIAEKQQQAKVGTGPLADSLSIAPMLRRKKLPSLREGLAPVHNAYCEPITLIMNSRSSDCLSNSF
jgi:hypothetical protein